MHDKDIVRPDFDKTDHFAHVVHSVVGLDHERGFKATEQGMRELEQRRALVVQLKQSVRLLGYSKWLLRVYLWVYLAGFACKYWTDVPASLLLLTRLGNADPTLILVPWFLVWVVTLVFTNAQRARLYSAEGALPHADTHQKYGVHEGIERWK